MFCSNMMKELGFGMRFDNVPVYIDNTSTLHVVGNQTYSPRVKHVALRFFFVQELVKEGRISIHFFFLFFSFISLIADGPHHYHPACGHKGSSHLSPVHALHFFYRDASSALLQLVNQWLNFTYSRSHAFRYERKNTNPTLVRIELTTSVLADVQFTY